jgi:DNA repair exonuclease SbcCD nuclease subunit
LIQNQENVFYHSTIETIHKEHVSITFFPFTDRKIVQSTNHSSAIRKLSSYLPYQIGNVPPGNSKLLVGHLALEGSIYVGDEIDDQSVELHCPLNMFSEYDYVFMGHIHKPQIRQKEPNFIAHIGSLDLSDFGEIDHQKQIVLFDSEKKEIRFIPVPSRPLRKFSCHLESDVENIVEYVREKFSTIEKEKSWKNSLLKMEISSVIPFSDELRSELKKIPFEFGVFHLAYFLESIKQQNISEDTQTTNDTLSLLTPEAAIKKYAQTLSLSEEHQQKFITIALNCLQEVSS